MSSKTSKSDVSPTPAKAEATKVNYRPDLDGLRGIAIAFVVFFHVWMGRVSGGVDVFLALSGFFFLGSLVRNATRPGSNLSPVQNILRLLRRLWPALIVAVAATVALTMLLRPQATWTDVFSQAQASLLYYQNWELAMTSQDYAAADASISPLQHLWSMSVQGQFYLIALALVLGIAAILRLAKKTPSKWLYAVLFAAVIAWSMWRASTGYETNQPWNYYDTGARLWELFLGGLLAIVATSIVVPWFLRQIATIAGLAMIVSCGLIFDGAQHFPSWAAWYPVGGALLIVVAGRVPEDKTAKWYTEPIPWLLATKPMRRLGDLGYSLYVWHWPLLIMYLGISREKHAGIVSGLAIILISLCLAWVSERYIERPLRMKSRVQRGGKSGAYDPAADTATAGVDGAGDEIAKADADSDKAVDNAADKDSAAEDADSSEATTKAGKDGKSGTSVAAAASATGVAATGATAAVAATSPLIKERAVHFPEDGDDSGEKPTTEKSKRQLRAEKREEKRAEKRATAVGGGENDADKGNTEKGSASAKNDGKGRKSLADRFLLVGSLCVVIVCALFVAGTQTYWVATASSREDVPLVDPLTDPDHPGAREFLEGVTPEGGDLFPSPIQVGSDLPTSTWDGCISDFDTVDVTTCVYGDPEADKTVALVGGSHSEHWLTAFDEIGKERGFRVVTVLKMGCPLSLDGTISDEESMYAGCVEWTRAALETIVGLNPDFVATTATRPGGQTAPDHTPQQYVDLWKFFADHGLQTLAIRDTPWIDHGEGPVRAGECLGESDTDPISCGMPRDASLSPENPAIVASAGMPSVHLLDFSNAVCDAVYCPAAIGNVIVYHDSHHLSATFVRSLRNEFENQMSAATGWW
ncbi:acyltransferase family protein [Dietzia sp.]|uniref:acyltransferase family protein n=1 Tax=Dietzia sp. TaxID=1871616 RepID=UPI002FDAFB88